MKYKFEIRKNGILRFRSNSALEIVAAIRSVDNIKFFDDFDQLTYKFFIDKEEKNLQDLKNLALEQWNNSEYGKIFNELKTKKQKKFDEQFDKLSEEQKALFKLLHGNLTYLSYDECEDKSHISYPLLFGISLKPISVSTREIPYTIDSYEFLEYHEYHKILFNEN
jgi:hypothetical protein